MKVKRLVLVSGAIAIYIATFTFSYMNLSKNNERVCNHFCDEPVAIHIKRDTINIVLERLKNVTATVYRANIKECDGDYLTTASGLRLDSLNQYKHRVIAISTDLKRHLSWGDSVYVVGVGIYNGWWQVNDAMNSRWRNKVDLLINSDMPIGKWNNVKIFKKHEVQYGNE
jgi:3D (Asp-Asp-Asp) domain-containing protein